MSEVQRPSAVFDDRGHFDGYRPRECGEHRTVGSHRAWCYDDGQWCYPKAPCRGCELAILRVTAGTEDE